MNKFMLNITASSGEFYQGDCEDLVLQMCIRDRLMRLIRASLVNMPSLPKGISRSRK